MKNLKFLLLLITIFSFSLLSAQTEKGSMIVGGDLGFSSQSRMNTDETFSQFEISPIFGYFVEDNIAAGARLSFVSEKFSEDDDGSSAFSFGPFARYYTALGIFGEVAYTFTSLTILDRDAVNGSFITPRVGYAAFINDHVSVEPSIYYSLGGGDLYDEINIFGIDVGFNIYLP